MKFNAHLFDLEFEGEISPSGIKVVSARKMTGPTATRVFPMNIRTRPSPFRHGGFDIYINDERLDVDGEYVCDNLTEAFIEISSYCLKQMAFSWADETRMNLKLKDEIEALTK
jgi:hypothetical protein